MRPEAAPRLPSPAAGPHRVLGWCLSLALLLAAWAGPAHAQRQRCEIDGRAVNLDNGSSTAGLSGMVRCHDLESGRLAREMELRRGVFVGIERFFEADGGRRERTINERGNTDGWHRTYGVGDRLLREEFARDGTRVGLARVFHPDGSLKSLSHADDTGREQARAEFTTQGRLASFRCATTALLEGDEQRCGFKGAPVDVDTFRDDGSRSARLRVEGGRVLAASWFGRDGIVARSESTQGNERILRTHHASGAVRREQVSDTVRQERLADREFSESGTKLSELLFRDGARISEAHWYQNGQPRERTTWTREGNRRIAHVERFDDAGSPVFSGSQDERGRPLGVHRQFGPNGKLRIEQHFDDAGRINRRREFDETGRLVSDDELFADGSRRAYAR